MQKKTIITVLNVVIVLLCIGIAGATISAVREYIYDNTYDVDGENYLWKMKDGDYWDLIDYIHWDTDITEDKLEYIAVAEYFEAASFYKAYESGGDSQKAEEKLMQMNDAAGRMGQLIGEKEKIDTMLGIESGEASDQLE